VELDAALLLCSMKTSKYDCGLIQVASCGCEFVVTVSSGNFRWVLGEMIDRNVFR